jgi:hypothetical protein
LIKKKFSLDTLKNKNIEMGPNWKGYVLGVVSKIMMIVEGLK